MSTDSMWDDIKSFSTIECSSRDSLDGASPPSNAGEEALKEEEFFAGQREEDVQPWVRKLVEEKEAIRNALRQQDIEDRKQDRHERRKYSESIFRLVASWLFGVCCLLAYIGGGVLDISESVQLALVGGTTCDVLGLMIIVALYLFPRNGH